MPIVPLKCPNCGGQLEIDSEKDAAICKYCGQPFIVKDAIVNTYAQNVTVNANQVNITNQKDFDIQGGVLVKYLGEDRNVIIPNNVVEIGESAFTESCIESVVIPDSVKRIKDGDRELHNYSNSLKSGFGIVRNYQDHCGAFSGCHYLKKVVLPNSLIEIGESAFCDCIALEEVVLSENLKVIGKGTFENCESLKRISIPNGINKISEFAFACCYNLETVNLPLRISLDEYAFDNCRNLSKINISDDSYVNLFAFDGCRILSDNWKSKGLCIHCGAPLKGLLLKECTRCHSRNY